MILTDGSTLVATRWNQSLWWVYRKGVRDCEICGIPHVEHDPSTDYRAVIVASEPISNEDSRKVPDRSCSRRSGHRHDHRTDLHAHR